MKANSMLDTLRHKIEDAKLSIAAWSKSKTNQTETVRYWEGRLEAFEYALQLLNWKNAGDIE